MAGLLAAGSTFARGAGTEPPFQVSGNSPGVERVVYGFFDDATGEPIGRLRIERVGVESRKQGFLRVAWRPVVVLEDVTLEIAATAQWPMAGQQILRSLHAGRAHDATLLRNIVLRLPGAEKEIRAAAGRLRPDGALELEAARRYLSNSADGAPATFCFWLAGPLAGKLTRVEPAAPKPPGGNTAAATRNGLEP